MALALFWLGVPVVQLDGVELRLGAKAVAMLAMLSLDGRLQRRDLARLLWSAASDSLNSVSAARVQLGKVLGQHLGGDTETLILQGDWTCDVLNVRSRWEQDTKTAFDAYRGVFLEGLRLPEWSRGYGEEFEAWLYQNRESLEEMRLDLATRLGSDLAAQHKLEEAIVFLRLTQASAQPREDAARLLLLCLGALGRPDEAMKVFASLEQALQDDLGVAPLAKTRQALDLARAGRGEALAELQRELGVKRKSSLEISQSETEVPLVGRVQEQQQLRAEMAFVTTTQARLVWLSGEPGVGKTRLARAFMDQAANAGWLVAFGEASQLDSVFGLLERSLRRLLRQTPISVLRVEHQEAIQQLLGENLKVGHPELSERVLLEAWRTLLTQQNLPALLVLDDLQWADQASVRLVMQLLRAPPDQGLLVVATVRDTENAQSDLQAMLDWIGRKGHGSHLHLTGLNIKDTESLAETLGRTKTRAQVLHQSSGGNPFFLLELLRSPDSVLPTRVQDALRARIARLPAVAAQMLDALAVLGTANQGLLREVAGRSLEETAEALELLEFSGLIRFEHNDLFFAHDLTREVALQDLSHARFEVLNLRTARALRPSTQAAAHYWAAKNVWNKTDGENAASVFIQAGVTFAQRGILQSHWFERAIEIAGDLRTRARAFTEQGRALERFGQHQTALEALDHAQVLLEHSPDMVARAAPLVVRANILALKLNQLEEAVPLAEQALQWLAREGGEEARLLQSDARSTLGTVARLRGNFSEAAEFFAGALRLRQALGDRPRIAAALNNLGTALVGLKDPKSEQTLLEGVKLCEAIGDVVNLARCLNNLGVLYNDVLKRHDAARAAYLRVLTLQSEIGDDWGIAHCRFNLGVTAFHQQEFQEAKAHYLVALEVGKDFPQLQFEALYNLAEVELALAEHALASTHIEQLLHQLEQIPSDSSHYDAAFYTEAKILAQTIKGVQ